MDGWRCKSIVKTVIDRIEDNKIKYRAFINQVLKYVCSNYGYSLSSDFSSTRNVASLRLGF